MSSWIEKHRVGIRSVLATLIIMLLIYLVIIFEPNVKQHTIERFTNSNLVVDNKYTDNDGKDNYIVLRDDENDFVVTIKNSAYYDSYTIGDTINANRYVMVHQDGEEELIYYFSEKD